MTEEDHLKKYKQKLHKDHADHTGANDIRNAIPACKRCNSRKHQYNLEPWFRRQKFFNEDKLKIINRWLEEGYKEYIEIKLPYRIIKNKNEYNNKFHHELWSVNEIRDFVKCLVIKDKKKDLEDDINKYFVKEDDKYIC